MRTGQRSTTRVALIAVGVLIVIYLGNVVFGYWQASRMELPPLKPSRFTVFGFPSREMEERRWKIITTYEIPKVMEQLRETQGLTRPEFGAEDTQNFRRVEMEEVVQTLPVVLTEKHIEKAWVEKREAETLRAQPAFYVVHFRLTNEGRARLWHYARENLTKARALGEKPRDEKLLIVIKEGDQWQSWAAPMISSEVGTSWWLASRFSFLQSSDVQIKPIIDEEIANIIVKGVEEARSQTMAMGGIR